MNTRNKRSTVRGMAVGAIMAALGWGTPAAATEPDFSIADPGWHFQITPYAWMVGVAGDISAKGHTVDVNASFYDIMTESDYVIPLMAYLEARNGRFSVFADLFYTQMQFPRSKTAEFSAKRKNIKANLSLKGNATITQTLAFAEGGVAYEVANVAGEMGMTTLEVLGGGRYWYSETDGRLKINGTVDFPRLGLKKKGKYATTKTASIDWIDPVIGARVTQDFGGGNEFQLLGDLGGFGIGSEFTWQLYAGFTHSWVAGATTWAYSLGYRALYFDYETGSGNNAQSIKMTLHGPIAGLTARW